MEGGVAVMKGILQKKQWSVPVAMFCVIVCMIMTVSFGYSQVTTAPKKEFVIKSYEIEGGGWLTAIDLKEKWAVIDDRKWGLTEDFDTKGLPPAWIKQGGYKTKKGCIVRYYVSLRIPSDTSLDIGEKPEGKIIKVINVKEIQELFERGGKAYFIEVLAG